MEKSSTFFVSETYVNQLLDGLSAVSAVKDVQPVIATLDDLGDGQQRVGGFEFLFSDCADEGARKRPAKAFVHLTRSDLRQRLEDVCSLLARCTNYDSVVERLVEKALKNRDSSNGAIVLLNLLVLGKKGRKLARLPRFYHSNVEPDEI